MTTRTSEDTVIFKRPFVLGGFDEVLPAGIYNVETDEELLEGLSFLAYRRVANVIHLPSGSGHPGLKRALTVDPNELDAALERDRASKAVPAGQDAHEEVLIGAANPREEEADRQAIVGA